MQKSPQAKSHVNHKPTPQPAVRIPEAASAYPAASPYAQVLQLQAVAGNGHATRVVQQARQRADKAQPLFDPRRPVPGPVTLQLQPAAAGMAAPAGPAPAAAPRAGNPPSAAAAPAPSVAEDNSISGWALEKVAAEAAELPGFELVTVLLGINPITSRPVARSAMNLTHALLMLVPGGEGIFQNLQSSGALERTFAWLNEQVAQLNITWEGIKALLKLAWDAWETLHPLDSIERIIAIFKPLAGRVVNFALAVRDKILEFVLEGALQLAGPNAGVILGILRQGEGLFKAILENPIGFAANLAGAIKQGFGQFVANLAVHLPQGLVAWLTGALSGAGIVLPERFDLPGIFQLVMQVAGLGFETLTAKASQALGFDLARVIEPAKQVIAVYQAEGMAGLAKHGLAQVVGEEGVQALINVVEIAQALMSGQWGKAWLIVSGYLDSLKAMVLGKIEEFVGASVIKAGVTKVLSLFNPASAFITACKAIYDIVTFFMERGQQIMALMNAVVESIGALAAGNIGGAAAAIENSLARGIPVAIGFLSSLLGLGDIGGQVQGIIQGARAMVDRALDAVFNSKPVQMVAGFVRKLITKLLRTFGGEKANAEKHNEASTSATVKAEALAESERRLHQLERADQIPGILDNVFLKYQPQGLDSLKLRRHVVSGIIVEARASKPETRTITWDEVLTNSGTSDFKDAQVAFASSKKPGQDDQKGAPTVVAMVTVNGVAMGPPLWNIPGEDMHAEDRVIAEQWPLAIARAHQAVSEKRKAKVVFAISATPCGRCFSNLQRIIGEAKKELGEPGQQYVDFTLAPRSLYEGKLLPKDRGRSEKTATSGRNLMDLSDAGWDIRQFAARDDIHQSRRYWDQPLAEYAQFLWKRATGKSST